LFKAPQPRSRLYTSRSAYLKSGAAIFAGQGYEGPGAKKLEQTLSEIHGCPAVAMPMARVGIYLTLKHLIRPGQKVILSPYTISDVVNMVLCAGGVPAFADIEPTGTCNINPERVLELLKTTADVGAVLVTHFYGLICDIRPILSECERRGIPVIEDAAQAFGAKLDGAPAGSMGHAGILSFGLLKHVTGFVGGAVLTRDPGLEQKIRQELAGFPVFPRKRLLQKVMAGAKFDLATSRVLFDSAVYWIFRYAYLHDVKFFNNKLDTDMSPVSYSDFPAKYAYQLSSVQAEIVRQQLPHFEQDIRDRIASACLYHDGLSGLPGLMLPPLRNDGSHIYLYFSVLAAERDKLALFMTREMRDVQISHHRNCASLECFSEYRRDCPHSELASQRVIYLPLYPGYRRDQIQANVEAIRRFFRSGSS
jgi:dTDP-4-amino-4,6-dideoxygalactose transaminase